jgi:hypothetical protein
MPLGEGADDQLMKTKLMKSEPMITKMSTTVGDSWDDVITGFQESQMIPAERMRAGARLRRHGGRRSADRTPGALRWPWMRKSGPWR